MQLPGNLFFLKRNQTKAQKRAVQNEKIRYKNVKVKIKRAEQKFHNLNLKLNEQVKKETQLREIKLQLEKNRTLLNSSSTFVGTISSSEFKQFLELNKLEKKISVEKIKLQKYF